MNKTQIVFAIMMIRLLRMILVYVTLDRFDGPSYEKLLEDSGELLVGFNKLL